MGVPKTLKNFMVRYIPLVIYWVAAFLTIFSSGEIAASLFDLSPAFRVATVAIVSAAVLFVPVGIVISAVKKNYLFLTAILNLVVTLVFCLIAVIVPERGIVSLWRGTPIIRGVSSEGELEARLTIRENGKFDVFRRSFFHGDYTTGTFYYSNNRFVYEADEGFFDEKAREGMFYFTNDGGEEKAAFVAIAAKQRAKTKVEFTITSQSIDAMDKLTALTRPPEKEEKK